MEIVERPAWVRSIRPRREKADICEKGVEIPRNSGGSQ
jgi:hypothetical protein